MNEIIDLLQSLMQQVIAAQDEFSEEEMANMFKLFEEAAEVIRQQEAPIEAPSSKGNLPSSPYPSSNVNGFLYDPDTQELKVQFHGPYPQAAGSVYSYTGVPKYLFDIIQKGSVGPKTSGSNRYHQWLRGITPSLGGTVNAILKAGGFPYQRLS